jgi:hypothetical protein
MRLALKLYSSDCLTSSPLFDGCTHRVELSLLINGTMRRVHVSLSATTGTLVCPQSC